MAERTRTLERPGKTAEGRSVTLRAVDPEDLQALKGMLNEPGIRRWWGLYDDERIRADFLGDRTGVYVIDVDGTPAGAIEFVENTDEDYRHADLDLFVTDRMQNHGIGTQAIKMLCRYLFEELGHHRLTAAPGDANEQAIRFFGSVGFRKVGVLRQYERQSDGTWGDNALLELVKDDFRA